MLRAGDPPRGCRRCGECHGRWPRMPLDIRDSLLQQQAFVAMFPVGEHDELEVACASLR